MKIQLPLALLLTLAATFPAHAQPTTGSNCLAPSKIQNTGVLSDREILFYMNDGTVWKNTLRAECPGLKFEKSFSWSFTGDMVCSNTQFIYVLPERTPCALGDFTAYTPPPKPAQQ